MHFVFTAVAWLVRMCVLISADVIVWFFLSRMNKCLVDDRREAHML